MQHTTNSTKTILKTLIAFAVCLLAGSPFGGQGAFAQAPSAIPYQGVARNASGEILASQTIGLRISLRNLSAIGAVVFRETFTTTTTALGLFNVNMGTGTPVTGTFAAINWSNGAKFVQVEMDPAGGVSYTNMGATQLMSVPYAILSDKTSDLPAGSGTGNTMHLVGTTWTADNTLFNNGSNIGIGTTSPANKLSVTGNANFTGNVGIGTPAPLSKLDVEGGIAIGTTYSGTTAAPANGAIIEGNVGVGTTNPANKLDVEGGLAVGATYAGTTAAPANGAIIEGNVGVGTTTPGAKLDVAGTIKITDGTQGTDKILTSDATGLATWATHAGLTTNGSAAGNTPYWNGTSWIANSSNIFNNGGNVGIGTTTPASLLSVGSGSGGMVTPTAITMDNTKHTTASFDKLKLFLFKSPTETYGLGLGPVFDMQYWAGTSSSGMHRFYTSQQMRVVIDEDGLMGIGTSAFPSSRLHVFHSQSGGGLYIASFENPANNNASFNNGIKIVGGHNAFTGNNSVFANFVLPSGSAIGAIYQSSSFNIAFTTTSDERLKTNITNTKYGLSTLKQIDVKDYFFKSDTKAAQTGFIAQQLYQHYPFAVIAGGDDAKTRPWMVDYGKLTPLLVKSIQEQQEQLDAFKAQIEALKAEIEKLKATK